MLILISHGLAWVLVVLTLAFRNQMIRAYQRRFRGVCRAGQGGGGVVREMRYITGCNPHARDLCDLK